MSAKFMDTEIRLRNRNPEWEREVRAVCETFAESTGAKFSPSKLDLLKELDSTESAADSSCTERLWTTKAIENSTKEFQAFEGHSHMVLRIEKLISGTDEEYEEHFAVSPSLT
jgi:hypothetical protein